MKNTTKRLINSLNIDELIKVATDWFDTESEQYVEYNINKVAKIYLDLSTLKVEAVVIMSLEDFAGYIIDTAIDIRDDELVNNLEKIVDNVVNNQ